MLDAVIVLVGPHRQRTIWNNIIRGADQHVSTETFRIFLQSAVRVLKALALWSGEHSSETTLLENYVRRQPAVPQWTSSISLAEAVVDVIRFLAQEGIVSLNDLAQMDSEVLEQTLAADLDWLDVRHLTRSVLSLAQVRAPANVAQSFVLRPRGATPMQRYMVETLERLVIDGHCQLEINDSAPQGHLLRLIAVLAEQLDTPPSAAMTAILESIVVTWMALKGIPRRAEALTNLRRGILAPAIEMINRAAREDATRHIQTVAHLGEPAIALVEALDAHYSKELASAGNVIESKCAGLFLLVRAVQDIRLTAVVRECDFASMQPLLTGLAIRIGGACAWVEEQLDPGAALWSGIEPTEAISCLSRLDSLNRDRFHEALIDLLSAQRLIDPSEAQSIDCGPQLLPCTIEITSLLDTTVALLLRAWARWLPGLSAASAPYLLHHFIQRPGTIEVNEHTLDVHMPSASLDVVLKMAGYLNDCPAVPWLGNRTIRFHVRS